MSEDVRQSDLNSRDYPIREDMVYQVKVWRFERWGWYGMVLVVLLALAGLFSHGPLSTREAHGSDRKISVEYELFHRNGSTNAMKISVVGISNSTAELELTGNLMDGFSIETMQPEPVRASSGGQGLKLWLQTDAQGHASVYLTLLADGPGLFSTRLQLPGAEAVNFNQYILP
ncbi:hypothetical protein BJ917_0286 [Pseudomonas sp. WPR_5_2]|uniref:hypothetical protein n=1 Tax=Pseudomonas sp. WPR_5_2 TaxID=1907371 RepID=UPI000EAB6FCF|nr:hypothetical protein [Pseudomonas sp. WPR_5_2]RKS27443.1 hypothetical protein BJ917_0286 [Pseudomonas sp. WPR_5_2]